ncbi:hypothetical protein J7337_013053 [Fusarium musae]|uniref:Uncharacterized protein n=1 Tax=Fusarium musae TaxID=1042133 RepID=A0A9P8D6Y4_9HYPO|nr:hypothetical protein J7337_013053 [Fusarium musae]KAG9496465.1 hypothetical protein J7337_013053 [Fusarium musae]
MVAEFARKHLVERQLEEASDVPKAPRDFLNRFKEAHNKDPDFITEQLVLELTVANMFAGSDTTGTQDHTTYKQAVRVRLQSKFAPAWLSLGGMTSHVITAEGCAGLYAGLSAALLRQFTYSTIRFGVYEDLKSRFSRDTGNSPYFSVIRISLSALSGFMGGVLGNPADIVNVKMQFDMSRPVAERRNYQHAIDGILRIVKTEGFRSLYRGVSTNAVRAFLMNSSQLASYDVAKV